MKVWVGLWELKNEYERKGYSNYFINYRTREVVPGSKTADPTLIELKKAQELRKTEKIVNRLKSKFRVFSPKNANL